MVGIGGRSKACENCRRRRVKCDLTAPQCQRCMKARLRCGGCRDMTIIHYAAPKPRVARPNSSPTSRIPSSNVVSVDELALASHAKSRPTGLSAGWRLSVPHDEIFANYTRAKLFRGDQETIMPLVVDSNLPEKCFIALSTTYFGVEHMNVPIIQRGFRRYSSALSELSQALGDPKLRHSFGTLGAVLLMTVFELLVSDSKDGWVSHSRGIEQLLKIQGPESMVSLPFLSILEKSRIGIVSAALVQRQRTILSQPEWKELPWVAYPERKDAMKFLVDIMADCPEPFAQRHTMEQKADENTKPAARRALLDQARRIHRDLECWERTFMSAPLDLYTEIPSPPTTPNVIGADGQSRPAWSTVLQYKSLHDANPLTLYNGVLILVLRFIQSLELEQGNDAMVAERMYSAGMTICRSADYHIEAMWDSFGSMADPVIGAWVKGVLDRISSGAAGRWATAQYLLTLNSPPTQSDGR